MRLLVLESQVLFFQKTWLWSRLKEDWTGAWQIIHFYRFGDCIRHFLLLQEILIYTVMEQLINYRRK